MNIKFIFLVVISVLLLVVFRISAKEPDILWMRIYGDAEYTESGTCVQQTDDGGYMIVGNITRIGERKGQMYLLRTDENGDTLWTKRHDEGGRFIFQTDDGGFIIGGSTILYWRKNEYVEPVYGMLSTKIDSVGDIKWQRQIINSPSSMICMRETQDGDYIVAGQISSHDPVWQHIVIVRIDANCDTIWTRTHGVRDLDFVYDIQQTRDGGYVIVGDTKFLKSGYDIFLLKTDGSGNPLWSRTYRGMRGTAVCQTQDGGYLILAPGGKDTDGLREISLIRTDADGNRLWRRTYNGHPLIIGSFIEATTDAAYIIGCAVYIVGGGPDIYLIKVDENGDEIWKKIIDGGASEMAYFIQQTKDGGYIVVGRTADKYGDRSDVLLIRLK